MHQYPLKWLKCGCESRSRCTTVTLADVSNIGMGLGTPIFTLLWSSSRPSPGISSAGVEPVRGAASFGGALVAQIHPRSHRSSPRLAVVPGSQSIQFAIFAGTMVLIDHILDDLDPLSTHVILIVFLIFGYFWRVMVAGVLSPGALGDPGDCHPCHSGGTACGQASCRPVAEWGGLARLAGAAW